MYPWKRFWCALDTPTHIVDGDFLYDPEGEHGEILSADFAPLISYSNSSCVVMLGEPGIGKSTEFNAEFDRILEIANANGDQAVRIDLKDFQTDTQLISEAFEEQLIHEWQAGSHLLYLCFDSLDEGQLEVRNIASVLGKEFRKLQADSDRLRVRITCRTAEWPASLAQTLDQLWGAQAVVALRLAPLRRMDVTAAAEAESIQPDEFLEEISRSRAQPFAANPVTLRFLLAIFKRNQTLPATRSDLYIQGCTELCRESSLSRHEAGQQGNLSVSQRMRIGARIAAVSVFCNRPVIATGPGPQVISDAITVAELAGGRELVHEQQLDVSESDIREVLQTALFSGRATQCVGFAHRTFAEFLAAQYVSDCQLDDQQVVSLVFHHEISDKVVPQLNETAAWIAQKNRHIVDRMLAGDPQMLLRSDVTTDGSIRSAIVARMIDGLSNGELDDSDWDLRRFYCKLSHAELSTQLAPVIRDRNQNYMVRRFVADVAGECKERGLLVALTEVACDESDNHHIRTQAANAVAKIGKKNDLVPIIPLALGLTGDDPNDELRGIALRAIWPARLITADELFSSLIRPKQAGFLGKYSLFLSHFLPLDLRDEDLVPALRFCSELLAEDRWSDYFEELLSKTVEHSISLLDRQDIYDAFIDYVASRIQHDHEVHSQPEALAVLTTAVRRRIVASLVTRFDDPERHWLELLSGPHPLLRDDDLEWILNQSSSSQSDRDQRAWAILAHRVFRSDRLPHIQLVLDFRETNNSVRAKFAAWFDTVEINSPRAAELRKNHNRYLELERRSRERLERPRLEPSPAVRIQMCLDQFESGDLAAWVALNRGLQLNPNDTRYRRDLKGDLTALPGWERAGPEVRSRILGASKRYLVEWVPQPDEWIDRCVFHLADFSGFRALLLVMKQEPSFLDTLTASRWADLAPVILGYPCCSGSGDEVEERQQELVAKAFLHAPEYVVAATIRLIDRESAQEHPACNSLLRRVENCWKVPLVGALVDKLRSDASLSTACFADILERLVRGGCPEAAEHATLLVQDRSDDHARALAMRAAVVLWLHTEDGSWDVLWPVFQDDREFYRDVIAAAAHDSPFGGHFYLSLSEDQLADLYLLLSQEFPHAEDPRVLAAHRVETRESIAEYRESVLQQLRAKGTVAACTAISRLKEQLPFLERLDWTLRGARRVMLQSTWSPVAPSQLRELMSQAGRRLVRNGQELQAVVLESLGRLQQELRGETPAIRDLWDRSGPAKARKWRPVDENDLSDYIARHLGSDLQRCGIIALREVEIRRGHGQPGERTDIYVNASVAGSGPEAVENVRVILEVKGCWHQELKTAMESQLKNRYLKENDCEFGIYLVGWFACEQWNKEDSRRGKTPSWSIEEARSEFERQKGVFSDSSAHLEAMVLDLSLI